MMRQKDLEEVEFQLKRAFYWLGCLNPLQTVAEFPDADEKFREHLNETDNALKELRKRFETSKADLLKDVLQELELKEGL
jgi:hypothetical protein